MFFGDTDWPTLTEVDGALERIGKNYSMWNFGSPIAIGAALITATVAATFQFLSSNYVTYTAMTRGAVSHDFPPRFSGAILATTNVPVVPFASENEKVPAVCIVADKTA